MCHRLSESQHEINRRLLSNASVKRGFPVTSIALALLHRNDVDLSDILLDPRSLDVIVDSRYYYEFVPDDPKDWRR